MTAVSGLVARLHVLPLQHRVTLLESSDPNAARGVHASDLELRFGEPLGRAAFEVICWVGVISSSDMTAVSGPFFELACCLHATSHTVILLLKSSDQNATRRLL